MEGVFPVYFIIINQIIIIISLKIPATRIVQLEGDMKNSLLKYVPVIPRVMSLDKTLRYGLYSLTAAGLTDPELLSLLPQYYLTRAISWFIVPPQRECRRKERKWNSLRTLCFLLTLKRGLVGRGILSNDLNISYGSCYSERNRNASCSSWIYWQDRGPESHVTLEFFFYHGS